MKKVAIVAGGLSSEREISLLSGKGVLDALKNKGYSSFLIDLTSNIQDFIRRLTEEKPDVIFNALHGKFGEDGNVQGLFNLLGIPYTHSGCLASALSMDKKMAKQFFAPYGIPVAKDKMVTLDDVNKGNTLPLPYVIKPHNEGSSIGVFIIKTKEDEENLKKTWPFGTSAVMMEEYIQGREMSVAVLNDRALGIVEIVPKSGFYNYENKYIEGKTDHIIPAPVPLKQEEEMKKYALLAHKCLGCKGASRSDFRYDDSASKTNPRIVILEINNQPGMTPLSLLPEIAKKAGLSYEDVVSLLVESASCEK